MINMPIIYLDMDDEKAKKYEFLIGGILLIVVGVFLFALGWTGFYQVVWITLAGLILTITGLIFLGYFIWSRTEPPPENELSKT
jgi:uncharacterized membrane protein HdeD (DUF308 family)